METVMHIVHVICIGFAAGAVLLIAGLLCAAGDGVPWIEQIRSAWNRRKLRIVSGGRDGQSIGGTGRNSARGVRGRGGSGLDVAGVPASSSRPFLRLVR